MAFSRAREDSTSTSSPSRCCYDVFLSFRGEDTRKKFTDHLYTAFVDKGFSTFRDEEELERGEDIKPKFKKAIQQSRSSVIIFSKDYASSKWCLDELVTILEHKRISDRVVLPVFYDIDPSLVRKQTGSVGEAFARHEENPESSNKMKQWREALTEVADLAGLVLQNQADGYESKFIKKIVKVIDDKLSRTPLTVAPYLIGVDSSVKDINLWLQDGSTDVGVLLINGVGGIGKTTIAQFAYNSNFRSFEGSCFLEDVRETSEQPNGLVQLQMQFLYHIFSGREVKIHSVNEGINRIRDAIISKRVLIVLDDVDHMYQINAIFRMRDWFYPGSKIIITTRCAGLLRGPQVTNCTVFNVQTLGADESLELFSWHAFGQGHPIEGYMKLSNGIAERSEGLPLALQILGSSLSGRTIDVWESTLEKLKAIPHTEIFKKLRISYDALQDNHDDQNLFLHIACFFVGKEKDYIVRILDGCDFFTTVGIENLVDRCLVTIGEHNKVKMHQMICDMGREIVRLESKNPEKRSRLWHDKDSFNVLREKSGTETIEGLALNTHMLSVNASLVNSNEVETDAFARMCKLRLLHLSHVRLNGRYDKFPKGLRWLCWLEFPLKSIPSEFPLECLVCLEMRHSSLRQVLNGTKHLPSLKTLDLSHSLSLTEIGNFSLVPSLERLILENCASLDDVPESIGNLHRLVYLNMIDCKKIRKLPRNLFLLKLLETLIISGCSNLSELPRELRTLESLKVLDLAEIPISQVILTSTGEDKSCLRINPGNFWVSLPSYLVQLNLTSCNLADDAFPIDFGNLPSLELLDLSDNPICGLPDSIRSLRRLDWLSFYNCKRLETLVGLPRVGVLGVSNCELLEKVTFQSSSCIPLEFLSLYNPNLVEIEYSYKLQPIRKFDAEMIGLLGLSNLESTETIWMLFPIRCLTPAMCPIQGLYEYGIFSTFLPGNAVPGQFSHKSSGSSISVTIPSNVGIRGLNVFSIYTWFDIDGELEMGYNCNVIHPVITKVYNKSTGVKWIYNPSCFGIPHFGEDMIFLSHWNLGSQLKGGDILTVSIFMRSIFQVKELGIQLVYDQEENMISSQHDTSDPSFPSVLHLADFEMMPRTYFLAVAGSVSRRRLTFNYWKASFLFHHIFGDSDPETDEECDHTLVIALRRYKSSRNAFLFWLCMEQWILPNSVLPLVDRPRLKDELVDRIRGFGTFASSKWSKNPGWLPKKTNWRVGRTRSMNWL